MDRREFLRLLGIAAAAGMPVARAGAASEDGALYDLPAFGNARLLHFTDCHAQLRPVYFREPNVNLGIGPMQGQRPHVVGKALLEQAGVAAGTARAHALTYLDFEVLARKYGIVFNHL